MKKTTEKTWALVVAAALCITTVAIPMDARVKKPKLNIKKITLKSGEKKKIKIQNAGKVKKVTWKSKKYSIASLTKKTKKSVTIVAKKPGKTTVICQFKIGKKVYKLNCKVTVKTGTKPYTTENTGETQVPEQSHETLTPIGTPAVTAQASDQPGTEKPHESVKPSEKPEITPSSVPSDMPTIVPETQAPTSEPTQAPATLVPTKVPTSAPTAVPTKVPTSAPTAVPTKAPTSAPTKAPTSAPTKAPTSAPTKAPTSAPTTVPTKAPTSEPTKAPTSAPTKAPTSAPATAKPAKVNLNIDSTQYTNKDAYAKEWSGNVYDLGALIAEQGYQISDFEKATIVIDLLDENKEVIADQSGASLKLSTNPGDWAGFVDINAVKSGQESDLKMDDYPKDATDLYLIVQNANTYVKYIRVTSVTFDTIQATLPTIEPTKVPATSNPTETPAVPAKVETEFDASQFVNTNAYTGVWSPSFYNIGELVTSQGYQITDFTDVKLTMNLLDADKNIIEGVGGASAKLVKTNNDWSEPIVQVHGVQSDKQFGMELETYPSEINTLYLLIQNSNENVKYVQITSVVFENNGKKDATEAITMYEPLKDLAEKYGFQFGTNISPNALKSTEFTKLFKYHFNSTTFSNEMKAYSLLNHNDSQANYVDKSSVAAINFTTADKMVEYAQENGLKIRGHVLTWDADMCDWFFREGYKTDGDYVSADVMKYRLKMYIEQVMTHFEEKYPGMIYCWDVVNEAVADNSGEFAEDDVRHVRKERDKKTNLFYKYIGKDYVELSFQYAYETRKKLGAEDRIKLFYNDYNTFMTYTPNKRNAIMELVKSVNSYASDGKGGSLKLCDGIGMQSYIGGYGQQDGCMKEYDITAVKEAIELFATLGVEVHVTELAVRNYNSSEEYTLKHAAFYKKLMQTYIDINKEAQAKGETGPITSLSIWGLFDAPYMAETDYSYKMNGPYCGLFTELYQPKEAFKEVYKVLQDN